MYFEPGEAGSPPSSILNTVVVPRPIGWISTVDAEGLANLAPYSFFNAVSYTPPRVIFSSSGTQRHHGGLKDSVSNIRATGEFVANLATFELREAMNRSSISAPSHIDEFDYAGLEKAPSRRVRPPRVAASPVQLECVAEQIIDLTALGEGEPCTIVVGRIVAFHIDDAVLVDGRVDIGRLDAIARLGYDQYARVTDIFAMTRPHWPEA
ncbi:MAG: flavin reductase family protein [Geminicoccaceae bacterium]